MDGIFAREGQFRNLVQYSNALQLNYFTGYKYVVRVVYHVNMIRYGTFSEPFPPPFQEPRRLLVGLNSNQSINIL